MRLLFLGLPKCTDIMRDIEVSFSPKERQDTDSIVEKCSRACGLSRDKIAHVEVLRRSIDARGGKIAFKYKAQVYFKSEKPFQPYRTAPYLDCSKGEKVVIIGAGPAGLFAALTLLQRGLCPVILERGKDVHSRKRDTARLMLEQVVDPDSNYCFGEGGAGCFSDGKLYTRSTKKGDIREVLYQLVQFGADPSILIDAHPHIGSNRLPAVIEEIRKCITAHGGEVHFNTRAVDFVPCETNGGLWSTRCVERMGDGTLKETEYLSKTVILACGHSAKDIYQLFYDKGWALEAKGFALGVRAEHPQSLINDIQYHGKWDRNLPPAEYSLVAQIDGRGVFSFCMCPGGILLPSSTSPGEVVLNGMSNSQRNSPWANAGIVTSIEPEDVEEFSEWGPLKLLKYQEKVEQGIFSHNGGCLKAPAQRMDDFCKGRLSADLPATSYKIGAYPALLSEVLPAEVYQRLKRSFFFFDKKMRGYYTSQSLLLAVESRTSSPVRIPRDPETLQHISLKNLFPCGEGAGYSGGIVSSALDGINVARKV